MTPTGAGWANDACWLRPGWVLPGDLPFPAIGGRIWRTLLPGMGPKMLEQLAHVQQVVGQPAGEDVTRTDAPPVSLVIGIPIRRIQPFQPID
jgi:hypothetical protein